MNGYAFDRKVRLELANGAALELPGLKIPSKDPLAIHLAGVDEVGRGPLAGPVVAAAVILPPNPRIYGLRDSKVVPAEQREALYCEIQETALAISVAFVDVETIDAINIFQASMQAMREAIARLALSPDLVLVDGNQKPNGPFGERAVVKADTLSAAVMAAAIFAKVERDHFMIEAHERFPEYGFDQHKGYACRRHLDALRKVGSCPLHRRSFEPIKSLAAGDDALIGDLLKTAPSDLVV